MKLIDSKVEYLPQGEGLNGIYKMIEIAGRVAYQSLDKITDDSAKIFVDRMINSKHFAALEHGTVYLEMPYDPSYEEDPYSGTFYDGHRMFVSTNYRVLVENNWLDDLQYLREPTENHEKRYTFRFTCSRAIAQELTRHRVFSFLMESQRYVNYSKEKYGNNIPIIIPSWCEGLVEGNIYDLTTAKMCGISEDIKPIEQRFLMAMTFAEEIYYEYLEDKLQPQQARDVLPNATKTELIMTGFASDWRYLLDLRLFGKTGKSHPDMINLMEKLRYEALEAGIWHDIMKYPSEFK